MEFINAIILLLNYTIIPALTYGSQLALGAIFVTLVYGILRFANFATGDMMSFGTMIAVLLTFYFQSLGISFGFLPTALLTIPFAIIGMIFYMLFIDKFVFSYYRIKTEGLIIKARPNATCCLCPPDNSPTIWDCFSLRIGNKS